MFADLIKIYIITNVASGQITNRLIKNQSSFYFFHSHLSLKYALQMWMSTQAIWFTFSDKLFFCLQNKHAQKYDYQAKYAQK